MRDDQFEWDDRKAAANLRKHKISSEVAREAFEPAWFVDLLDDDPDEPRYLRIANVRGELVAVVYAERGHRVRIISARKATARERDAYADQG
ncbi:MAG: BrnT family toxin [Hyphomicrobiaceae bacterium]